MSNSRPCPCPHGWVNGRWVRVDTNPDCESPHGAALRALRERNRNEITELRARIVELERQLASTTQNAT